MTRTSVDAPAQATSRPRSARTPCSSIRSRSASTRATPRSSRAPPARRLPPERRRGRRVHAGRARARSRRRPARERHGARRRRHAARRRARARHDRRWIGILEVRPEDRLAWVEPGVFNLDLATQLAPHGLHVRARSLLATGQLDRRQRQHERRRAALPRATASRAPHVLALDLVLADGTIARVGCRGAGGARLRPPRLRRRLGGNARRRHGRVRPTHADRPRRCARCSSTSRGSRTARRPCRRSSRAASCPRRSR